MSPSHTRKHQLSCPTWTPISRTTPFGFALKQSEKGIASTHSLQADKLNAQLPEFMLNFGVWGPGSSNRDKFVAWNRDFERKVHELGGQKWLYAHTYYTEAEFDEIYNRKEYDALREKYHATYLPSVYDNVKVDVEKEKQKVVYKSWGDWLRASVKTVWPLQGLYGVYKCWRGGEYLLPRAEEKSEKIE